MKGELTEETTHLKVNLFKVGVVGVSDAFLFVALAKGDGCSKEPGVVTPSVSTSPSMTQSKGPPTDH